MHIHALCFAQATGQKIMMRGKNSPGLITAPAISQNKTLAIVWSC